MPAPEEVMREAGRLHEMFTRQTYDVGDDKKSTLIEAAEATAYWKNYTIFVTTTKEKKLTAFSDEHDFIDDICETG